MSFDLVIPTYGRSGALERTFNAYSELKLPGALKAIHVVENGEACGAESVCARFMAQMPIRYHYLPQAGLSGARNLGIDRSESEYLIFFDDDIRPLPEALQSYARAFQDHEDVSFFGGPVLPDYEVAPPHWLLEFLPFSASGFELSPSDIPLDKPRLLGGNFAIKRSALEAFGRFEGPCATGTSGGGVGEETRLQERLLMAGHKGRYLQSAAVMHYVPVSHCSEGFAKHRRWRVGFGDGQLRAGQQRDDKLFLGAPRWCWRNLASALSKYAVSVSLLDNKAKRFSKLLEVQEQRGFIAGYREHFGSQSNIQQK